MTKKQLHAEAVADVLEQGESPMGARIDQRPGSTPRAVGFGEVKVDAQQQGGGAQGIE